VVVGYSFPAADVAHLSAIFPRGVLVRSAELIVIDPANADDAFRARVSEVFPSMANYDFSVRDFRAFSARFVEEH